MSTFLEIIEQRIQSIDAPLVLPLSPSLSLSREEETPEEVVMNTHQAFDEVNDIIAGVLIDSTAFLRFGSLGVAALEAIFDIAREYDLPIIMDAFIGASSSIPVVLDTFSTSGAFPADAIRIACVDTAQCHELTAQSSIPVFLPEGQSSGFVYSSGKNAALRTDNPDAFVLIDGSPVAQFRNQSGSGVLHVAQGLESLLWHPSREGQIREALIDCAKQFLSTKQ